jgi:hypothetical protein
MKIKDITEKGLTVQVKGGEILAEKVNGKGALTAANKYMTSMGAGTVTVQIKAGKALLGVVSLKADLVEK